MTTTDRRRLFLRADGLFAIPGTAESGGGNAPEPHAATHEPGGSDEVTLAQSQVSGLGQWQDEPFNAAHFAGSGTLTWTVTAGQVGANRYTLIGKTLIWSVFILGSTLSGTAASAVILRIPGGYAHPVHNPAPTAFCSDGLGLVVGEVIWYSTTQLAIQRTSGGALQPGAFSVTFTVTLEIA